MTPADKQLSRWILRAQFGDRRAWDKLLRCTQPWLYRYLQHILKDSHSAEDVLQDVLLLITRKLSHVHSPKLYRPWVYRIATREAFRYLKHQRNRKAGALPDGDALLAPSSEHRPPVAEEWSQLHDNIEKLTPNIRAVVILHYGEGLSIAATAEILGIPLGTAKSRLAYGLEVLRNQLRKDQ